MNKNAFSLIEILVVVALLAIVISIAVPALFTSREDTIVLSENATAKTLNDAVTRAIIKEDPQIQVLLQTGTQEQVIEYLVDNNYIELR